MDFVTKKGTVVRFLPEKSTQGSGGLAGLLCASSGTRHGDAFAWSLARAERQLRDRTSLYVTAPCPLPSASTPGGCS